jgi:GxxExxY protein
MAEYLYKELTREIIGAAMEVHSTLGWGFLESVYEEALTLELESKGIIFERQKSLDVFYKGRKIKQFFCDLLIDGKILIELKAIKELAQTDMAQVLNYLKATNLRLGLLLNFGAASLQYKRIIN